jgi:SAM-dependent methyltransferase
VVELARSFDLAADAYERGRPRYPPDVVSVIADAAGGPRIVDVGAGTGRLSEPLLRAGNDVVAVEPLDRMRAILAGKIGRERALAGCAEALPLDARSVDGAVVGDAWHWFDGARAAGELHRVVRPGGGVVVCVLLVDWDAVGGAPEWARQIDAAVDAMRAAVQHPSRNRSRRPAGLDGHPGFAPIERSQARFVHRTDRDEMLDHLASMSAIASLPPARRDAALSELKAILVRHGVAHVDVPQLAELWVTRRLPDRTRR